MTESPVKPPVEWSRRTVAVCALFALAVLGVNLATSRDYGITSDEPVIYFAGARQLWALGSDLPGRWDFKQEAPAEFKRTTRFDTQPWPPDQWSFPGFPGFFCTLVARVARHLPGYTEVDAVHAGIAVLHAFGLFMLALYLSRLFGLRRALLTVILLALFPSAAGHSHYNVKDWPQAIFYALTIVSFLVASVENRALFALQSGLWLGLGLASKANPVFAPVTILLWLPLAWRFLYRERLPSRLGITAALLAPALAVVVFYASWPYLQHGTPKEQWNKFADVVSFFMERAQSGHTDFSSYPFLLATVMTPPILLVGLALAAFLPFRASAVERAAASLGWVWLLIPLVRISLPHSNYYDANRHFIEYVPALAFLAAQGLDLAAARLGPWLAARIRHGTQETLERGALAACTLAAAIPVLQYHPFESTYYNLLVGGLGGAQKSQLTKRYEQGMEFWFPDSESDYWGFSYRRALREVSGLAETNAAFYGCGNLIGKLTRYADVRPDLREAPRDSADWFVIIPRRPFCSEDDQRWVKQNAELVREERRDGGLVYGIWHRRR